MILMVFKKAVLNLLVVGPFLLLGLIGLNARMNRAAWSFVEYGPVTSNKIYAYIEPIIIASLASRHGATEAEVLDALGVWTEGLRSGYLNDVPPASAELDGISGAYQQILASKHMLLASAEKIALSREKDGDFVGAAEIYSMIIEIGDVAKYSEFSSFTIGSVDQAKALRSIARIAPKLTVEERKQVALSLRPLTNPRLTFLDVIENISAAYQTDRARAGEPMLSIVVSNRSHLLASNQDSIDERLAEWQRLSISDPDLISLYGKSRIAYLQHVQVSEATMIALAALDLSNVS